jgi:MFS family permease
MDLPPVRFPFSSSVALGVVALIHITLVTLALTGPLVAVATEYLGLRRQDARYDALAKRLTQILIEATVIGGIFGSAIVVLLLGFYPILIATLFNIFFWLLVLQLLAGYLINLLFMTLYLLRWERMKDRRRAHMALGIVAAIAPFLVATVFNAAVTFMGTPGLWPTSGRMWHAVLNPTFGASFLHRVFASLALVGALIVAQALWRKRAAPDPRNVEIRYGSRLAVVATALQVIPGLWYYFALPPSSREVLWMGIYGVWIGGILAGLLALAFFAIYGLATHERVATSGLWAAIGLTVLSVWLMGWTRSATRGNDLIAGVMSSEQKMLVTPSSLIAPADAQALFAKNCGMCHPGLAGDAISKSRKYQTDKELRSFLEDPASRGVAMPPVQLPETEMNSLIRYLREQAGAARQR